MGIQKLCNFSLRCIIILPTAKQNTFSPSKCQSNNSTNNNTKKHHLKVTFFEFAFLAYSMAQSTTIVKKLSQKLGSYIPGLAMS